ncbi:uncharacterized protein LOC117117398 isoform X3 [Anneissia japonica]|uniref:uncharacterized protein LOC117117398 isoform X3 n=1 Tax=Anneissia japonica TaxID=1529436 RepID=UPI0014259158|nr:uncharacterized protein LOC117117398 isoform X3 [Anneissia japonica]
MFTCYLHCLEEVNSKDCSKTFDKPDSINLVRNASLEGPWHCHYRIKAPKHHVIDINITELNVFPLSGILEKPCVTEIVPKVADVFGLELKSESCCSRRTPFHLQSSNNKVRIIFVGNSQECLLGSLIAIFNFRKKDDSKHICDLGCPLLHGTTSKFNNSIMSTSPSTLQDSETDSKFYSNLTDKPTVAEEEQQFDFIIIWIIAPTCLTLFCVVACCVVMFSRNRHRRDHHHQVYVPGPVGSQTPPIRPLLIYHDTFSQVGQQERLREQGKMLRGTNSLTENYPASVKLPDGEGKTPQRIFLDVYLENEPSSVRAAPNVVVGGMQTDFLQSSLEKQKTRGSPSFRSNVSGSNEHRTPSPRLKHGPLYIDSVTRTSLNILDTEDLPPYNKATAGQRSRPATANAIPTKDDIQSSAKDKRLSEKKIKEKQRIKGKENDKKENNNS